MEITKAAGLFSHPDFNISGKINWADLGCGTGTFTLALASLLPNGSSIYAMDTNEKALQTMPDSYGNAIIRKLKGNFVTDKLAFDNLDGVLMANSLHYVKDKPGFIQKLIPRLNKQACVLLVEYDTGIANNWVPYPQTFSGYKNYLRDQAFHPFIN
jgi:ubiquinone/menaquinone biosynthesis C-methylase UbiE